MQMIFFFYNYMQRQTADFDFRFDCLHPIPETPFCRITWRSFKTDAILMKLRKDYEKTMQEELVQFLLDNQQKFYRYAFTYVHHKETAMDMVHSSFLKALEQLHTLRNPAAMKTWFYRILTNECLQTLKKSKRENLIEPTDIQDEIYLEKAFEPDLELYETVRQLAPETQTIIFLHYYEEYTLKEIAQITDCNLNTVKSRLYAGLKKLKEIVKEDVQ